MFLDIGASILLSIFVCKVYGITLSIPWIIAGAVFVFLPDIDVLPFLFKKYVLKKNTVNHRSALHYPAVYLPVVLLLYILFGAPVTLLYSLCVLFHFMHDTLWLGWGVAWFWPISDRRFKFFPDRNGKISSQLLMTWTKEEEPELLDRYHNPNWIRDFYLQPNIVAYAEYSVFFASILYLYLIFAR